MWVNRYLLIWSNKCYFKKKKKKKKKRLFRDARLGIFKKMSCLEVEREKISDNEI